MRIEIPNVDARTVEAKYNLNTDIIDAETQRIVGVFKADQGAGAGSYSRTPARSVSLFDGKYYGRFETQAECEAFAKGVEAVLNHMTTQKEERFVSPPEPILRRG